MHIYAVLYVHSLRKFLREIIFFLILGYDWSHILVHKFIDHSGAFTTSCSMEIL